MTAKNISKAKEPEFFENEMWELIQLGLGVVSVALAGMSLPCCFLVCQRYYQDREDEEEEDNQNEAKEMSIIKPKLNRRKTKKLRFKKNNEETKAAVKGFLEEFIPKASAPSKNEARFVEIY